MGGSWKFVTDENLSHHNFDEIFKLYYKTYTQAGEVLWFQTSEQLYNYSKKDKAYIFVENGEIISGMLLRKLSMCDKIYLIFHNGTQRSKKILLDELARMLVSDGYIIEASGALSWVLRSRYKIMPQLEIGYIMRALDIENRGETIQVNLNYDINFKENFSYTRYSNGYAMKETLFGRIKDSIIENIPIYTNFRSQ